MQDTMLAVAMDSAKGALPTLNRVAVLGLGAMGSGIAQVCAMAGKDVVVREVDQAALDRGLKNIQKNLDKGVERGKLTAEQRDNALGKLVVKTLKLDEVADTDLVIEAMIEDIELKRRDFAALDKICRPETIFASNTSSLSITEMAAATNRPDRVVGLHFFNPPHLMQLVEVIRGLATSEETFETAYRFVEQIKRQPVRAKDNPGFIVNLLLVPYLNDGARAYEAGVASAEDIDKAMKLGAGHPMGPLELTDMIGIDVAVKVADILYNAYKEPKYAPPPILRQMAAAGHLGRKSGKGFYEYGK